MARSSSTAGRSASSTRAAWEGGPARSPPPRVFLALSCAVVALPATIAGGCRGYERPASRVTLAVAVSPGPDRLSCDHSDSTFLAVGAFDPPRSVANGEEEPGRRGPLSVECTVS